jgi:putrescine transport system ATP-binding protein
MSISVRMAGMRNGQFVQVSRQSEIYETPNCRFVADFIGNVNLFDGTLAEDEVDHCVVKTPQGQFFVGHGITGVVGQALSVAVRPEKIELSLAPPEDTRYNCLLGTIAERAYFGATSLYRMRLPDGTRLQVSSPNTERHGALLPIGSQVYATCASDSMVVLTQ